MTDFTTFMGDKTSRHTIRRQEQVKAVLDVLSAWAETKPYRYLNTSMMPASGPGWPGDIPERRCAYLKNRIGS